MNAGFRYQYSATKVSGSSGPRSILSSRSSSVWEVTVTPFAMCCLLGSPEKVCLGPSRFASLSHEYVAAQAEGVSVCSSPAQ